jgi:phage shock protein A
MNDHDRSSQLMGGIAVICVMFFGSMALVWSTNGRLTSEAKAAPAPAHQAAPHADATAGLEHRLLLLEAKMKAPPTSDAQLDVRIKGLESQIASVQTQLGAFTASDFDSLKRKVSGTENTESVKTSIDALRTDVGKLHTRLDQLSEQTASATASESKHSRKSHSK